MLTRRLALRLLALTSTGLPAGPALADDVQVTREVVAFAEGVRGTAVERPMAEVTLVKDDTAKAVAERLDESAVHHQDLAPPE